MEAIIIPFARQLSAIDAVKQSPGIRNYYELRRKYEGALMALGDIRARLKGEPVIRSYPDLGFVAVEKEINGENITLYACDTAKQAVLWLAEIYNQEKVL